MSKQLMGWGCAVLALVGLWTTATITAQEEQVTARSVSHNSADAEQRINAVLDGQLKTPLAFDSEYLNIILEAIADQYDIPIVFDKAALEELAISPETEVRVKLSNISLRSALNLMLREPGLEELCYMIFDEVLLITTKEKRNESITVKVYRVDDLLDAVSQKYNSTSLYGDPNYLINLIVANVEVKSWQENGTGEGNIHYYPPGMVVISQTARVHDHIEKLLDKLRRTKQQILKNADSTTATSQPATKGFAIKIEMGDEAEQTQQRLANAIKSSVDWSEGQLAENEAWIEVLPKRVLVRHLPSVLNQVGIVLQDMRISDQSMIVGYGLGGGGGIGGGGGGSVGGGGGGGFF